MIKSQTNCSEVLLDSTLDYQHYTELYNLTGKQEYLDLANLLKTKVQNVKEESQKQNTGSALLRTD